MVLCRGPVGHFPVGLVHLGLPVREVHVFGQDLGEENLPTDLGRQIIEPVISVPAREVRWFEISKRLDPFAVNKRMRCELGIVFAAVPAESQENLVRHLIEFGTDQLVPSLGTIDHIIADDVEDLARGNLGRLVIRMRERDPRPDLETDGNLLVQILQYRHASRIVVVDVNTELDAVGLRAGLERGFHKPAHVIVSLPGRHDDGNPAVDSPVGPHQLLEKRQLA